MSIRIGIGLDNFASAGIDANAQTIFNRIIADGGVSNLTRLNFFVKGLKAIYGDLANVPVCYDAHWIGYKLGSGTGATSGQAAAKLYSLTVAGDAVQSTAASQPLLLSHNGASTDNYWYSPQVLGNYCTAPSITIPTASGFEMDVKVAFTTNDDSTNIGGWFVSHDTGGSPNRNIFFGFSGSRTLTLYLNNLSLQATASTQFPAAFNGWFRVNATTVSLNMEVKFFTSTDGITFTQLGSTITLLTAANCIKTTPIKLDVTGNNGANTTAGKYFRAILKDANGVTRADFNPATYNASTSQTQWTSSTGEVWTINTGTATTGYKGVLVDRTIVQADGVDDNISVAISGNAIRTQYIAHKSLGANTGAVGGLFLTAANSQAFSYNSNKYNFYQQGAFDGPFGAVVVGTTNRALRISGAVGGTGTNWIPFQNGVDVSNGGNNIGLSVNYNILTLFSRGNITSFDNAIFNTYIMSANADDLTTRTASQAFAKSLNNNI